MVDSIDDKKFWQLSEQEYSDLVDKAVEKIKNWVLWNESYFVDMMEFIRPLWTYEQTSFRGDADFKYTLDTFGVSYNERLVDAILENTLGKAYLLEYRRGGHYVFAPLGYTAVKRSKKTYKIT